MAEAPPLDPDDLARGLAPLLAQDARGLVIGVSGGPDSMALMALAAALRRRGDLPPLMVGTVDHGLRPESGADAALVEAEAGRCGLPVRRLLWTGPKPARAIQEKARVARYGLLTALCREVGADHLATAHTLDDQAETVLFRLLRGSGVAGLAGMRRVAARGGLRHVRPLLGVAKARLVATCVASAVPYRDDPANHDPRYARARLRGLLPRLAAEGCDATALARLATRAARAEAALDHATAHACADVRLPPRDLIARVSAPRLAALPSELALRVLARAITEAGGVVRRLDRLERLAATLVDASAEGRPTSTTGGGMVLTLTPDGVIEIAPEAPRRRGAASPPQRRASAADGFSADGFSWQGEGACLHSGSGSSALSRV